jgi:NitT/TauT family transport system substrate-binding protein
MRRFAFTLGLVIILALSLVLVACGRQEGASLRMALLPIMDTLPFYVAEQQGFFADEGIEMVLLPAKSAQERDALMQAGEVDGMLTDLPGVGIFNRDQIQLKVVATARRAYPESPLFRVLAAPESGISTPAQLAGVEIAISQNTVIEYITDRLLTLSGVPVDQIAIQEISAIPVRFEQLMTGQIQAATLPDPLAQGAVAAGANLVVDDSQFTDYAQSVLVFGVDALENKPETITKFLNAWDRAAAELNENPEAYRELLIEQGRVPESIQGNYSMPPFPRREITSQAQWADIVDWLLEKGLIDQPIAYGDVVDAGYLR